MSTEKAAFELQDVEQQQLVSPEEEGHIKASTLAAEGLLLLASLPIGLFQAFSLWYFYYSTTPLPWVDQLVPGINHLAQGLPPTVRSTLPTALVFFVASSFIAAPGKVELARCLTLFCYLVGSTWGAVALSWELTERRAVGGLDKNTRARHDPVADFKAVHLLNPSLRRNYAAPGEGSIPPAKKKYVPTAGTYPLGFKVGSAHVGVKASNTRFDDLALVASESPCSAAAVFTTNKFQAAPVTVSREMLRKRKGDGVRAVIVNSGCANAVTGRGGIEDAKAMAEQTDECFIRDDNGEADGNGSRTIVMSTGVIGQRLPIQKITSKLPTVYTNLGSTHEHWLSTARAIMTTDTFPKLLSRTFTLPSSPETTYHIAGMTKGAGMIHPNMATLLGIVCTDAPIAPSPLHSLLTDAITQSFNSITIDGDTSTNDTVAILANGAAGGKTITSTDSEDYAAMLKTLTTFAIDLAQLVVRDGEGATKFVTVRVTGAASYTDAKRVANSIARSPLVKTALYGKDANWGRILCATGYAEGVESVVPERTTVSFVPVDGSPELKLLVRGEPEAVDEERAAKILENEDLEIVVRLNDRGEGVQGEEGAEAVVWTCDFSHEYVTINGDYRT
ncbi:ArgJ-domain-containing protein [Sporormia fimetaria CBS 119925]|uniref:Arginine biosynthesis bifunctional protein ArgJ, mitochondrial n=1 Tax=Sporormia fimetaria CBS 119925 TaxID=1340428 RepID=A0A6A6VK99_9PLEO|nr:ArgJ-domain-containing protein [Sporormia fimetaria CBS 119925]